MFDLYLHSKNIEIDTKTDFLSKSGNDLEIEQLKQENRVVISTKKRIILMVVTAVAFVVWGSLVSLPPSIYPIEAEKKGAHPSQVGCEILAFYETDIKFKIFCASMDLPLEYLHWQHSLQHPSLGFMVTRLALSCTSLEPLPKAWLVLEWVSLVMFKTQQSSLSFLIF